jgi:hypothetical protein
VKKLNWVGLNVQSTYNLNKSFDVEGMLSF